MKFKNFLCLFLTLSFLLLLVSCNESPSIETTTEETTTAETTEATTTEPTTAETTTVETTIPEETERTRDGVVYGAWTYDGVQAYEDAKKDQDK